jgi:hypothetical protein
MAAGAAAAVAAAATCWVPFSCSGLCDADAGTLQQTTKHDSMAGLGHFIRIASASAIFSVHAGCARPCLPLGTCDSEWMLFCP